MINCKIDPESKLGIVLIKQFDKMRRRYDCFGIITGKVGKGKSRGIFLNLMDFWYKYFHNKVPPKSCFGVSFEDYIKALKKGEEYDFAGLDEGGDIFDKGNSGQRMLIDLYQTYTIIREKRLFTTIVISSIFDLATKFAINRVKFWIHVTQRIDKKCKSCKKLFVGDKCPFCGNEKYSGGYIRFNYYSSKRLKQILQINQNRQTKSINCGVMPLFTGTIREYKGELCEYYKKLKDEKADSKLDELYNKYVLKETDPKVMEWKKLRDQGKTYVQIAEAYGVADTTVSRRLKNHNLHSA